MRPEAPWCVRKWLNKHLNQSSQYWLEQEFMRIWREEQEEKKEQQKIWDIAVKGGLLKEKKK